MLIVFHSVPRYNRHDVPEPPFQRCIRSTDIKSVLDQTPHRGLMMYDGEFVMVTETFDQIVIAMNKAEKMTNTSRHDGFGG